MTVPPAKSVINRQVLWCRCLPTHPSPSHLYPRAKPSTFRLVMAVASQRVKVQCLPSSVAKESCGELESPLLQDLYHISVLAWSGDTALWLCGCVAQCSGAPAARGQRWGGVHTVISRRPQPCLWSISHNQANIVLY